MRSHSIWRLGAAALVIAASVSSSTAATNEQVVASVAVRMQSFRDAQQLKIERMLAKIEARAAKLAAKGADPARIVALRVNGRNQALRALEAANRKISSMEAAAVRKLNGREDSDDDISGVHHSADSMHESLESHSSSHLGEFESHMSDHEHDAEHHSQGHGSDDGPGHT